VWFLGIGADRQRIDADGRMRMDGVDKVDGVDGDSYRVSEARRGFSEDSLGLPERGTPVCSLEHTGVPCGASRHSPGGLFSRAKHHR